MAMVTYWKIVASFVALDPPCGRQHMAVNINLVGRHGEVVSDLVLARPSESTCTGVRLFTNYSRPRLLSRHN